MTTGQREPTLLRGCSPRRPVENVEHYFIAAGETGEIYGQIPRSGVENHTELRPQSLGDMVIGVTPQDHADVPGATPQDSDCLLSRVFHGFSRRRTTVSVCRRGLGQRVAPLGEARHPPIEVEDLVSLNVRYNLGGYFTN